MWNFLEKLFFPTQDEDYQNFKRTCEEMKKYGGRMVVTDSGGMYEEWETQKGKSEYYAMITRRNFGGRG
ncbi:hypothetical protein NVP1084O_094 [Vibrio phage 1.084.O._10N.261.49.F5]|nr:hypothetical protein NVP1084O_094 [Vibrio phage 1.084.O._10N.261.49.F5]